MVQKFNADFGAESSGLGPIAATREQCGPRAASDRTPA
jgi:hypothetical protein